MSDAMTKAKLLTKMYATRREWEVPLAHTAPAQMMQPGVIGE